MFQSYHQLTQYGVLQEVSFSPGAQPPLLSSFYYPSYAASRRVSRRVDASYSCCNTPQLQNTCDATIPRKPVIKLAEKLSAFANLYILQESLLRLLYGYVDV